MVNFSLFRLLPYFFLLSFTIVIQEIQQYQQLPYDLLEVSVIQEFIADSKYVIRIVVVVVVVIVVVVVFVVVVMAVMVVRVVMVVMMLLLLLLLLVVVVVVMMMVMMVIAVGVFHVLTSLSDCT